MSTPPEYVRCPTCQAHNTGDAHYCEKCGSALENPGATTLPIEPAGSSSPAPASRTTGSPADAAAALLQLVRREMDDEEYDVEREIGRGGMAVVYRAIERDLRRTVAIKVVPPEMALGTSVVERFKREAQMAAALDHPNIIPVYRVGQAATLLYLAMKHVEGRPLDAIIAAQGALPMAVVMMVLRATASALAYAHAQGIVHRDIKSGNILVSRDGRVIVTDFGVARAIENASMTATGSLVGTPYFMSPEQCAGKPAGPQSDQYSLGVVAFQMLTGAVPFQGDTLAAIMHHHFFTPAPDVTAARDDVSPALAILLERVLAKDPARRYATTRDMLAAIEAVPMSTADRAEGEAMLRELAQGSSVTAVRTTALPPLADTMSVVAAHDAFRRSAKRVRWVRQQVGLGFLAALAAAIGLWLWQGPHAADPSAPPALHARHHGGPRSGPHAGPPAAPAAAPAPPTITEARPPS